MKAIYKQALQQFYDLIKIVNDFKGNTTQLCILLNGHNFDKINNQFDLNYGLICVTIRNKEVISNTDRAIEIWYGDELINTCSYNDLVTLSI